MHFPSPRKLAAFAIAVAGTTHWPITGFAVETAAPLPLVFGMAIDAINGKPKPEFDEKYHPVIVTEAALPHQHGITSFGKAVKVLTRDAARQEQLAWFVELKVASQEANAITLTYTEPASAHFGQIFFAKVDGQWSIAKRDDAHSSSAARNYYGALYEGVTCKDGTEMAQRWSLYADMAKAIQAGKMPDFKAPSSGVCPGEEFPEVAIYRSSMKH